MPSMLSFFAILLMQKDRTGTDGGYLLIDMHTFPLATDDHAFPRHKSHDQLHRTKPWDAAAVDADESYSLTTRIVNIHI